MEGKKTNLYLEHTKVNARMINFNGYILPVWFSSIKEEHMAVRNSAGMFDISHMGVYKITGNDAYGFLQYIICNDLEKTLDSRMMYGMVLNEQGNVLDDIMVGKLGDDFILVINAGNKEKILNWIEKHSMGDDYGGVHIEDLTIDHSFIAVQGPLAVEKLSRVLDTDLSVKKRFSIFYGSNNNRIVFMRTGYTGEDGYELVIPDKLASDVWKELMGAGITPCGLGARDTLRIEAGLPLYGQELSEEINPFMTRYSWVLKFHKEFIGRKALLEIKNKGTDYKTAGLEMQERIIARSGYRIIEGGHITSGTLLPETGKSIAMALVHADYAEEGTELTVMVRGKKYKAKVVSVPFK
ncbi:MAG: glycine cleavage system aminomethyltransferase GcvT [bacterium]|nr:glycine cleavage system aminomethyltransferase GcvT [bacterium]